MPVQNICPSKCQFSMPQITKARSLSALAAVVLLAGVGYAVSKPLYNFALQREIIWLKTPFDRIASIRDAICSVFSTKAEGSYRVELPSIKSKYEGKLEYEGWLKLAQSLATSHPEEARSIYKSSLTPKVEEFLDYKNISPELGKVEGVAFLLEAYKLGKSLGFGDQAQKIVAYVSKELNDCKFDFANYAVAVAEFLIDNPGVGSDVFNTNSEALIEQISKALIEQIEDRATFQDLNAHFFISILRLMIKANRQDEQPQLTSLLDHLFTENSPRTSDYELKNTIILDYLALLNPVERNRWVEKPVHHSNLFMVAYQNLTKNGHDALLNNMP